MRKTLAILLVFIVCLSLCACGAQKASPEEKLKKESVTFIAAYLNAEISDLIVDTPEVIIDSVTPVKENQWAVLGTATVAISETSKMSAKFGVVATYDRNSEQFEYSKVEFDEFK